jgi:signal transduction histidine kinase
MSILENNQIADFENDEKVFSQENEKLKIEANNNPLPTILCRTKKNNPNYFSIFFANQKFYDAFSLTEFDIIGKNYDFLFEDLDLDYSSEDQIEYIRLIKAVKDLESCSVLIPIENQKDYSSYLYKLSFNPIEVGNHDYHYAEVVFEKTDRSLNDGLEGYDKKNSNSVLLKNLERTLRKERLLREVASLIISDLPIGEISHKVALVLCEYLKADRCLIHDYQDSQTTFIVEHSNNYTAKFFTDKSDKEGLSNVAKYINFHNRFFEKFGNKDQKSFLTIIENVVSDHNFDVIRDVCNKLSISSVIAVTTTFNGRINGGIYIHQSTQRSWLEDEVELVQMIADQFSIAVDRSQSIEKVMVTNHALMERTIELRESLKQEQEMRKMQNEFVALVSHEFKTPLQIIDSTRELISRKIKNFNLKDESFDKALERIKSGIQRMNGLIHSTLNLARMESGDGKIRVECQVFDLKAFVLDIIEKNSNLATNKQIKILVKVDELPTDFNGDSKLLDHSITNIISNAIKYSKNNSTVKILAKSNDKKVALRVVDQGIGIPKDDLANIGQKFFRAKNTLSVAGTGIGIYLTKHFIELHGGDVLIESEQDVGTSVTVTLPRK